MSNKRHDFRVDFRNEKCSIYYQNEITLVDVINISGTGMSVAVNVDEFSSYFTVGFTVGGKKFGRKVELKRRSSMPNGKTEYGLLFLNQTEREREELHRSLVIQAALSS